MDYYDEYAQYFEMDDINMIRNYFDYKYEEYKKPYLIKLFTNYIYKFDEIEGLLGEKKILKIKICLDIPDEHADCQLYFDDGSKKAFRDDYKRMIEFLEHYHLIKWITYYNIMV